MTTESYMIRTVFIIGNEPRGLQLSWLIDNSQVRGLISRFGDFSFV